MKAEIRDYKLDPPFNTNRIYQAIFVEGIKTNFWRLKHPQPTDFLINKSLQELETFCKMINEGILKPSDKLESFDICDFTNWKPKRVKVIQAGEEEEPDYTQKLFTISGSPPDVEEVTKKAAEKHFTQYTKIVNREAGKIRDTCLVILYAHGSSFYAI
jgi:hypothetical protein